MSKYNIAIVGMGCIFPEANNTEEYWENILSGKQFVSEMKDHLWPMDQYCSTVRKNHKSYTKTGSFIKDFNFNALEYSLPPKSLEGVDKAQLVAMEATRQALLDAGIKPRSKELEEAITVIGGSGVDDFAHVSTYLNRLKFYKKLRPHLEKQGISEKDMEKMFGEFSETLQDRGHKWHPSVCAVGSVNSSVSNRIAQVFGAKGFNMIVDGACASSFVSLSVACHALMAGDAKIAIAGGIDLGVNPAIYIGFSRLGGLSSSGNTNPFDNDADGLIIGEGGGVVILKKLEDAIANGDKIHAVIKGIGTTSDGAGQAIYNPSAEQRSYAMQQAIQCSGIDKKQIQFLEAHATSTVVGDANEYDAISTVYADRDVNDPLYIGTVKHQIGHLKAAAGIAGLIKTVLAMNKGKIPHMPRFRNLTKHALKKADTIKVPNNIQDWKPRENNSRYAAVTTSGFGGVNYHTILEQAETYQVHERINPKRELAVVSISTRLPGADTAEKFWKNTTSSKDLFQPVDPTKLGWEENYNKDVGTEIINTPKIALLDDFKIDYIRHKISPNSVSQTSPTQILAVNLADRLFTDYGLNLKDNKNIGISIGAMHDDNFATIFYPLNADEYAESIRQTKTYKRLNSAGLENCLNEAVNEVVIDGPPHTEATLPGWMSNVNAGIIANRLNCNGPNFTVDTACSSGLASMLPAIYQLMFTDVDMMITGGLNRHTTNVFATAVTALGAISENIAAPFDKDGKGFLIGEGGVLYLLKRLEDAKRDGDEIFAVLNNVGGSSEYATKTMVAPSEHALSYAINQGIKNANIKPEQIGVVDTHGSANMISDIVEARSIAGELRKTNNAKPVHITAIKSHIGHSFGGSGAAGMLSVIQTLRSRTVPCIQNLKSVRPEIADVLNKVKPQPVNETLEKEFTAGGVTSLGLGGANYFAVLSIHDEKEGLKESSDLSAQTKIESNENVFVCKAANKNELINEIKKYLESGKTVDYNDNDICLTVAYEDEKSLKQKLNFVLTFFDKGNDLKPLELQGVYFNDKYNKDDAKLAFCFPGQGTHYITMGAKLYQSNPTFRDVIDRVHDLAVKDFDLDLKGCIYGSMDEADALQRLSTLEGAQISLFAISVGVARVLKENGASPDVMVGHSFGEVSALTFAEVWDLETAFKVVKARIEAAKSISKSDKTLKMLSVVCTEKQKDTLLAQGGDKVVLSNINAPGQYILSGEEDAIKKIAIVAENNDLEVKILLISSAFHSKFLQNAVAPFRAAIENLPCSQPKIPILSTITGKYVKFSDNKELADTLSKQLVTQLNMPREINTLYRENVRYFLEIGPRWSLSKMIEASLHDKTITAVPTLHPKVGDEETFRRAIAFLININKIKAIKENIEDGLLKLDSNFSAYLKNQEPAILAILDEAFKRFAKGTATIKMDTPVVPIEKKETKKIDPVKPSEVTYNKPIEVKKPEVSEPKADTSLWIERSTKRLAESTGYPEDMLGVDLDLEADLGIDSVQRAEIWGAMVEEYDLDREARPEKIRTINELANELTKISGSKSTDEPKSVMEQNVVEATPFTPISRTSQSSTKEDIATWVDRATKKLAKSTGYPEDMLGTDLDLEADLGIDSVQRAEIWGAMVEEYDLDKEARPESIKTITELANELSKISGTDSTTAKEPLVAEVTTEVTEQVTTQKASSGDVTVWIERATLKLADSTGYPADMLGADLDLEADLGIDSVQRAEIWGAIVTEYDLDKEARPESIRTINQLAVELQKISEPSVAQPSVPAEPEVIEAPAESITPAGDDMQVWVERSTLKLADSTGYPADMLGADLDLEADLGIDSVQRAEIWGAMVEEFNLDREARPESIRTINQLAEELQKISSPAEPSVQPEDSTDSVVSTRTTEAATFSDTDCRLFYSSYTQVSEDQRKPFECKKVVAITGTEADAKKWKAFFNNLNKESDVFSTKAILSLDDKEINNIITSADTLVLLSHKSLINSKKTGTQLGKLILQSTLSLYEIFRKLSKALRENSIRVIVPINQDGAFGAYNADHSLQGSFPAGFIKSIDHELPNCDFQLIDSGAYSWEDTISKSIDTLFTYTETGLLNDYWVRPILLKTAPSYEMNAPVNKGDLILVTGGARGIVYKCVLELAKRSGCKLLLTGRTELPTDEPEWLTAKEDELDKILMDIEMSMVREKGMNLGDAKRNTARFRSQKELYENLKELESNNIEYIYKTCDVQYEESFAGIINETLKGEKIKGIVHGAGVQKSRLFDELTDEAIELTIKTKLNPLFIMTDQIDFSELKMFTAFGSIAGLFGNDGQSDYALGNDMLACAVSSIGNKYDIFTQTIEWTAWVGTGMVSDAEAQRFEESGLIPLTVEKGVLLYIEGVFGSTLPRLSVFNEGASFTDGREIRDTVIAPKPKSFLVDKETDSAFFSLDTDLYINQHLVQSKPVVPGTFTTEIFSEALKDKKHQLADVKFKRPLWVRDKVLTVEVVKDDKKLLILPKERAELSGKALETLSYANCDLVKASKVDEKSIPGFTAGIMEDLLKGELERQSSFYSKLDNQFSHILKSGPIFRGVKATLERKGLYYALISLTDDALKMFEITGNFVINPVVADMAIQASAAWGMERFDVMAIPFGIGRLTVFNQSSARDAVVICTEHKIDEKQAEIDIVVREPDGKLIFTMDNVILKTI